MKYTEEIFNILSKGGFISANSVSPAIKRYYDAIEEDLTDYYEYYKGIVFSLDIHFDNLYAVRNDDGAIKGTRFNMV